ncbi:MAG: pantetheine-phosphate adenylyltransferase [Actinobacteria bacterium]|jgi:pantetheine-phosphate adenylyltransferase|nr:pantetheine-phosphate adenylyltransferase [Actinomycetota bacterium]
MAKALCPGSFDPPTNGHIDVVERAARYFEGVVVAVIANPSKQSLFSAGERSDMLSASLAHVGNVEVASFDGLLVDFARSRNLTLVVKGLRAVSDFEYELQMAQMNATLEPGLDTMFMAAKPSWAFLSSSLVKEVARFGGSVEGLVPPAVGKALRGRYRETGGR